MWLPVSPKTCYVASLRTSEKAAAAIRSRMNDPRQFGNSGKCSSIKNIAPDPGSCTRVTFAAAGQGPDFFIIRSSAGQDAADRRNGEPAGELFSLRDLPSMTDCG